jgi:hypothetical protein
MNTITGDENQKHEQTIQHQELSHSECNGQRAPLAASINK